LRCDNCHTTDLSASVIARYWRGFLGRGKRKLRQRGLRPAQQVELCRLNLRCHVEDDPPGIALALRKVNGVVRRVGRRWPQPHDRRVGKEPNRIARVGNGENGFLYSQGPARTPCAARSPLLSNFV